ncbi:hypothetical protein HK097_002214 [Rhizophlyctis rosea]|uniref:TIR domain-containing protein n=1 Tax=Rhizophlyctis rosea TaxID=64517 RepID=A0AAD5X467_9FUNG|nr:hypothetical protein HK097_002214 [Rhizophlyctis rosea]
MPNSGLDVELRLDWEDSKDALISTEISDQYSLDLPSIASINGHLEVLRLLRASSQKWANGAAIRFAAENGHRSVFQFLLGLDDEFDNDADQKPTHPETLWSTKTYFWDALTAAIRNGHAAILECVIDHSALPRYGYNETKEKANLLKAAAANGYAPTCSRLLNLFWPKYQNSEWLHKVAVNEAIEHNNLSIVRYCCEDNLLDNHVRIELRVSALEQARTAENVEVIQYFLDLGLSRDPVNSCLLYAMREGQLAVVRCLLKHSTVSSWALQQLSEPIAYNYHMNAVAPHSELMEWLFVRGVNVDTLYPNKIVEAAEYGHAAAVAHFLKRGGDVGGDNAVICAFAEAARNGEFDIVDCMLRHCGVKGIPMDDCCPEVEGKTNEGGTERRAFALHIDDLEELFIDVVKLWNEKANTDSDNFLRILRLLIVACVDPEAYLDDEEFVPALKQLPYLPKPLAPNDVYVPALDVEWHCKNGHAKHDYFIREVNSYRVEFDAEVATKLRSHIMALDPDGHIYMDKECLVDAKDWAHGFMQGLLRSRVILLLCSQSALGKAQWANWRKDNMLLEWEHALELSRIGQARVLPIFITDKWGNSPLSLPADKFPRIPHCHKMSPRRHTVRDTIKNVFALQGKACNVNRGDQEYQSIARSLIEVDKVSQQDLAGIVDSSVNLNGAVTSA